MIRLLMLLTISCKSLGRNLPATSLVETVVSMTILLTLLTLSFSVLDHINKSLNPQAVYKAYLATSAILQRDDLLLEEFGVFEVDGYIVKTSIHYRMNGVHNVELTVLNGFGREIYIRKIVISCDFEF